jgi:ribosomal protein S18 acetylase RimI-like enzyme
MPRARRDAQDALTVRRATPRDVPRLARWNRELIEDEQHERAPEPALLEGRMRGWLTEEYIACVFEAKGEPVGYALFRELPDWMHLRHFFVARDRRREGIGRRAFERLIASVFPRGKRVLVEVLSENAPAVAFWRSLGFGERYVGMQYPATSA